MTNPRRDHLFTSSRNIKKPTRDVTTANYPLDGRRMGQAAHEVIGSVLSSGLRTPTLADITTAALAHGSASGATTYRQAARQRLISATRCYFAHFAPADDWMFIGSEVPVQGARFDIVWMDGLGQYVADEIKTSRVPSHAGATALAQQVSAELGAGTRAYGPLFRGVRVCLLHAPKRSFLALPDGRYERLD
jgi:hypothetical protein